MVEKVLTGTLTCVGFVVGFLVEVVPYAIAMALIVIWGKALMGWFA